MLGAMEMSGSHRDHTCWTVRLRGWRRNSREGCQISESSAVPPSPSPLRCRTDKPHGKKDVLFFLHKMSQCSTRSLLPPSSTLSSLPDVSPQFFRRSRYGSRLFSGRDNPWIPLWLSEGSRCEFGWLACIVSTILTSGNTHYARNCHWLV